MNNEGALIIFTKAPVSGAVKTRLIPSVGANKATQIYKELLEKTLATATKTGFSSIQLWVDGDIKHPFFEELNDKYQLGLFQQVGKDLGERICHAFDSKLGRYPFVVLIGSDCPTLTAKDLNKAGKLLASGSNVVLGPAEDGGYYLIGLTKNDTRLFEGIHWGKEDVMAETCRRLDELNWSVELLMERWDLDRPDDLIRYYELKEQETSSN